MVAEFKCDIKLIDSLGMGMFGVVYRYKKNCVIKVERISKFKNNCEFQCLSILYNKLHKILPYHVIQPITEPWNCKGTEIDQNILKDLLQIEINKKNRYLRGFGPIPENYVYPTIKDIQNDTFEFLALDKLGDFTLCNFIDKHSEVKEFKEIMFQLIIFLLYMFKYTTISHGDIHYGNIILKKNCKKINYVYKFIENKKLYCFSMKPKYLAYLIDFGQCVTNIQTFSDIDRLWDTFKFTIEGLPYKYDISEFLVDNKMNKYVNLKGLNNLANLEKILINDFFTDIIKITEL
jgi:hypothetical protein